MRNVEALLYVTGLAYQRFCLEPNDATAHRFIGLLKKDEAIFEAALIEELADATDPTIVVRLTEAIRELQDDGGRIRQKQDQRTAAEP